MATFNGVNLFGYAARVAEGSLSRDAQVNAFPGVNGIERLDGGTRGTILVATGTLIGTSATDLSNQKIYFANYENGFAYTLVDSLGAYWPNTVLESFAPTSEIRQDPYGLYLQDYEAHFRSLL